MLVTTPRAHRPRSMVGEQDTKAVLTFMSCAAAGVVTPISMVGMNWSGRSASAPAVSSAGVSHVSEL